MNGHLVAVEVSVESGADERVNLDSFALDEHLLKRLDSKSVECRSAIQKNWVLANHFFQNVPDHWFLTFHHLARLFDSCRVPLFFELVVNKRLEQLQGHLLGQTTLMKL